MRCLTIAVVVIARLAATVAFAHGQLKDAAAVSWLGALLAAGVMVGAIGSHLTKLGLVVQNDGGLLFALAVIGRAAKVQLLDADRWRARARDQQVAAAPLPLAPLPPGFRPPSEHRQWLWLPQPAPAYAAARHRLGFSMFPVST